jgi:hypothetical protein
LNRLPDALLWDPNWHRQKNQINTNVFFPVTARGRSISPCTTSWIRCCQHSDAYNQVSNFYSFVWWMTW